MRFRLVALDIDGTLLDPEGALRPAVRDAVRAARDRRLQVVLCTGRRYRTALPILREIGLEGAVIVQNGVLIKDVKSGRTLQQSFLSLSTYRRALPTLRGFGPPLVYVDHYAEGLDIVTEESERAHPYQAEYLRDNVSVTRVVESLEAPPSDALIMLSCMADEASLSDLRCQIEVVLGSRVRTHLLINKNYRGHILETVTAESGKWPALRSLAEARGIGPEEILAIGDDRNDVEMIAGSGLGVAMANAVETALAAADHVTGGNQEDGVVQAIERFVLSD